MGIGEPGFSGGWQKKDTKFVIYYLLISFDCIIWFTNILQLAGN
jgi:hypothetical protein